MPRCLLGRGALRITRVDLALCSRDMSSANVTSPSEAFAVYRAEAENEGQVALQILDPPHQDEEARGRPVRNIGAVRNALRSYCLPFKYICACAVMFGISILIILLPVAFFRWPTTKSPEYDIHGGDGFKRLPQNIARLIKSILSVEVEEPPK